MNHDIDKKLYNDYLNGDKQAFEMLYIKYNSKLQYFIYNIVKDYQKAEDITQEVFMYVLKNKFNEEHSFRYYIYLIAKSRAINYINTENRRNEIKEKYLIEENEKEKDILEVITKEEEKQEIIKAIESLDEKYKNVIYLNKIEGLSYKEVSNILNISLANVKTDIHRGKKELRKILIKKGMIEMNKITKTILIILITGILLTGAVYAISKIYENVKGKAEMTPTANSKISEADTNKVWVGTFNLVWNDFMNDVIGGPIEFEDGYSELAEKLNEQTFTVKELSENSYFKIHGERNLDLKNKIETGIKEKFNETSEVINEVNWEEPNGYVLYAMLKKEFNYLEKFPLLNDDTFGDSEEKVKYFGIEPDKKQNASKNIDILFYNSSSDFAVKLKTKEGDEVYLYYTTGEGKSFEENYAEMLEKEKQYTGEKSWQKNDSIKIPFIQLHNEMNYDELCNRYIKNTDWYILKALQTIEFELNNVGGSVKSEALIEANKNAIIERGRELYFNDDFILYMKEDGKEKPYFALKVDNSDVLVLGEN